MQKLVAAAVVAVVVAEVTVVVVGVVVVAAVAPILKNAILLDLWLALDTRIRHFGLDRHALSVFSQFSHLEICLMM